MKKIFAKKNLKYYLTEGLAVSTALGFSVGSALVADYFTDSNAIISATSTVGGSVGWITGSLGIYGLLNIKEYKTKKRNFKQDMNAFFKSNIEGIIGVWITRFPLQYAMQKFAGIEPALSATIGQFTAGQVGTVIRVYRNYKRGIFGHFQPKKSEKIKTLEEF